MTPDGQDVTPQTHGGTIELPLEALLDPDPELRLVRAPMSDWVDHEDDDPLEEEGSDE